MSDTPVTSVPTQSQFPWRTVARTVLQVILALAVMLPTIIDRSGLPETLPWVAGALAASAALTRIMASPIVNALLQRYLPWLAADKP